jgi:hypothetical protein
VCRFFGQSYDFENRSSTQAAGKGPEALANLNTADVSRGFTRVLSIIPERTNEKEVATESSPTGNYR